MYCGLRQRDRLRSLRERLNGHRHVIKEKEDTPVGLHFQGKHSVRVSVLASAPNDTTQRRLMEKVWIEQLSSLTSPWHLINRDRSRHRCSHPGLVLVQNFSQNTHLLALKFGNKALCNFYLRSSLNLVLFSSLPDEVFRRNVVEIVFGLLVFVNKMFSFSPANKRILEAPVEQH